MNQSVMQQQQSDFHLTCRELGLVLEDHRQIETRGMLTIVRMVLEDEPGTIPMQFMWNLCHRINQASQEAKSVQLLTTKLFNRIKTSQSGDLIVFCENLFSMCCVSGMPRHGPEPWEILCAAKSFRVERLLMSSTIIDPMFLKSRISLRYCLSLSLTRGVVPAMIEISLGDDMDWRFAMDCIWEHHKAVFPSVFLWYDWKGVRIDRLKEIMRELARMGVGVQDARDMLQFGLCKSRIETVAIAKAALDKHKAKIISSRGLAPCPPLPMEIVKFL